MTTVSPTYYFAAEGRPAMEECIRLAAEWCASTDITKMVIFTGTGVGPHYAAKELLIQERFKHLGIVAVTPPVGRPYRSDPNNPTSPLTHSGINPAMRDELGSLGIGIVSAHLPFKEMWGDSKERSSEWTRVAEAFGILGGGFAYCIQAVLVACDAGLVEHGARVVALSADTAIVVRACRTESFLSPYEGLLVEHIVCRPIRYNVSKHRHEAIAAPPSTEQRPQVIETVATLVEAKKERALPAPPSVKGTKLKRTASKSPVKKAAKPIPKSSKRR